MKFRRDVAFLQGTARVEVRVGDQETTRAAGDVEDLSEKVRCPPGKEVRVAGWRGGPGRRRRRRFAAEGAGERESGRAERGRSDKVATGAWGGGGE